MSDDHADCAGFRQRHHGDDPVVAAVLSMDVEVALKGGRHKHLFNEELWIVLTWDLFEPTCHVTYALNVLVTVHVHGFAE